jgi:hypothetical protein
MAKRAPQINLPHKYYIYYDKKTGEILAVGNEKSSRYENGIEVAFEDAEPFLTGKWQFKDYQVGYHKDSGKTTVLSTTNEFSGYVFNNKVFEWITEFNTDAECIVEWNLRDRVWNFSLSRSFKNTYNAILAPKLVFFVTLENDSDFLIRTIFIATEELLTSDCVTVPFESNIETRLDKIAISSKLVFKTYGLKVIYE